MLHAAAAAAAAAAAPRAITVTASSEPGCDFPTCTWDFHGDIQVGGECAGSWSAFLVNRDATRPNKVLFDVFDSDSGDILEVGRLFFDPRGSCRLGVLRQHGGTDKGGFLYIKSMSLEPAYREGGATDVGAAALREILTAPTLRGRWTVCAIIPDAREGLSPEDAEEFDTIMAKRHALGPSWLVAADGGAEGKEDPDPGKIHDWEARSSALCGLGQEADARQ